MNLPGKQLGKSSQTAESIEDYTETIQSDLRNLQMHNWWSWSNTVVVVLLLTCTIVSFTLPSLLRQEQSLSWIDLKLAVRALVGLVLLFSAYSLWQQVRIKNLCEHIQRKQASSEALYRMAMFDPLTGLYNRRFAQPRIEAEVSRCRRKGSPLTMLLLDLDRFKQVNDTHGHSAGDAVLRAFAEHITRAIRGSDLAVRLGGDEFMVLLPECDSSQLRHVLDRLVRCQVQIAGRTMPVEFSVGWKQHSPGETSSDLFEGADRALYQNKRGLAPDVASVSA